jgi:methyl-accepting chemotaxis protein
MQLIKWTIILTLCIWWKLLQAQTIKETGSKTGIYFDEIGTVLFYPTRWTVVTYINLEPTRELWKQTKFHQKKVMEFCQKIKDKNWYHYTDCAAFDQYMRSKSRYIDNLKDLVAEYLTENVQNENHRPKRGVLNFVGELSKILFGTLTQSDARNYNKHITELKKEQKEYLHLSKEQMTVIKTTITSVNSTLQKVNQNERTLRDGLSRLLNYSTHKFDELEEEIRNVNLINEQFRLLQRGVDESQHSFETLIDAFVHAAQGTLQPQLITSEKIRSLLKTQKLPNGLDYPNFPFSELQRIITPSTYAYKQYLVYILKVPLFSSTEYYLYKMLPFPVAIQEKESTYSYIGFNRVHIR